MKEVKKKQKWIKTLTQGMHMNKYSDRNVLNYFSHELISFENKLICLDPQGIYKDIEEYYFSVRIFENTITGAFSFFEYSKEHEGYIKHLKNGTINISKSLPLDTIIEYYKTHSEAVDAAIEELKRRYSGK